MENVLQIYFTYNSRKLFILILATLRRKFEWLQHLNIYVNIISVEWPLFRSKLFHALNIMNSLSNLNPNPINDQFIQIN